MKLCVHIRPLTKSDAAQMAKLANNENVWNNLRDYIPYPYKTEDAFDFIAQLENETPILTFGICFEDQLCGVIGLDLKTDVNRLVGELGYWIGESFWGQGIGTEAINLITSYGFQKLKLERIYATVFAFNKASMRALEKNGFREEGVLRNSVIKNEKIYNEHLYAKLKNE